MIVLENIGKPGVRGELENKECSKLSQKFVKEAQILQNQGRNFTEQN